MTLNVLSYKIKLGEAMFCHKAILSLAPTFFSQCCFLSSFSFFTDCLLFFNIRTVDLLSNTNFITLFISTFQLQSYHTFLLLVLKCLWKRFFKETLLQIARNNLLNRGSKLKSTDGSLCNIDA